ncbi:hypothetical protein HDU98_007154 [Podochytrium sp. JEL0797]|nr:hypothetical protein HDU98_007154 [Podochytrium sp. JEL0797]
MTGIAGRLFAASSSSGSNQGEDGKTALSPGTTRRPAAAMREARTNPAGSLPSRNTLSSSTTSSTSSSSSPTDAVAPRAPRQRPPSTYFGDTSSSGSSSASAPSSTTTRRERPDRSAQQKDATSDAASLAQSNKERDIARRHLFRLDQLQKLKEREDAEDNPSQPPQPPLVNLVDPKVSVVVIPGYGNDDDYVLEYLSASSASENENEYQVEDYSSSGMSKKSKRRQRATTFEPNHHRAVPQKSAVFRSSNSRKKRLSSGSAPKQLSGNRPVPSSTTSSSTSSTRPTPRTRLGSSGRTGSDTGRRGFGGPVSPGDEDPTSASSDSGGGGVQWDDVYNSEPSSPASITGGSLTRTPSTTRTYRTARPLLSTTTTTTDPPSSPSDSLLSEIMSSLTPTSAPTTPTEDDKMPEDREGRREWLKRRQQKRLSSTPDSLTSPLPDSSLPTSPSSTSSLLSPTPSSTTTTPSKYRLSNPSLPPELLLALDASTHESNTLRQSLSAAEHELSTLRLENSSALKRLSSISSTASTDHLTRLESEREALRARVEELEFTSAQLKREAASAKESLKEEIGYRKVEREQAQTQMETIAAERDAAVKEVMGKSVVLGSTEMIVNQTTKELQSLRMREREVTGRLQDREAVVRSQQQQLVESEEKLKRALGEVQSRSGLMRSTEERLRGLIQEMGNARAREGDLVRKLQESEARCGDLGNALEEFKKVSAENLYQSKQANETLRIEARDLQGQLNQAVHGTRVRDEEIKKNRELIQGMAGRIGAMDREIGNAKTLISDRDLRINHLTRDLTTASQRESDLTTQLTLLNQSHGGEMAAALTLTQQHQRELEKVRKERDTVSDHFSARERDLTALREERSALQETISELTTRVSTLDSDLSASQTLADETVLKIRHLTDELARAGVKERKMAEDQKQMQNRFIELDSIAQRLVADRDSWRNRATELERLLDQSRKEANEVAIMKENLERDMRNEVVQLQAQMSKNTADANQAAGMLKSHISNLEISLASAKARGEELDQVVSGLQGKLAVSVQNETYLSEQIEILKEARGGDMAAALERTEAHQRNLQGVITERTTLQSRLTELEAVLQHLVSDRDSWKTHADKLQSDLTETISTHKTATAQLRKSLEDEIESITDKLYDFGAEKQAMDARNAARIEELEVDLVAARTQCEALEKELEGVKRELFDALNNDHESVVQDLNAQLAQSASTQDTLNAKIVDLLASIKSKDKEQQDLHAHISELEETIDELMIEQDAAEKKVLKLQASVKKAKQEVLDIERTTDASITHLRDESTFGVKRAQDEFNRVLWNVRMEMNAVVSAILQKDKREEDDDEDRTSGAVDVDELFQDMKICRQKALEWIVTINVAKSESEVGVQNLAVLKNQVVSLQRQLGETKREVEDSLSRLEETKDLDMRQRQQIKILEQQLEKANKLKQDAEKRAISTSTESEEIILALQQEIISIRGELSKKSEILKRTTPAEIQELLKSGETELSDAKNAASAAEKELRALQRSIQEYEGLISKLQIDFEALETQFNESQQQSVRASQESGEVVEGLKEQLKRERASLEEAQEAILSCQAMIRDLEALRAEMTVKFEQQLEEEEDLYGKVVAELDSANAEVDELKDEMEELESKLDASSAAAEALEVNYQSVKDEIELMRNQRRESVEAMQSMIQSLTLRLQEEQELVEVNQAKWNEESTSHLKLVAQLETDIQEKNILLQHLQTSNTASTAESQALGSEIAALKIDLESKQAAFAATLAKVTKELETSHAEVSALRVELERVVLELAGEKAGRMEEVESLKAVVADLEARVQQAARDAEANGSAAQSSSMDVANLSADLQAARDALVSQKEAAEQQLEVLRGEVKGMEENLVSAQSDLSTAKAFGAATLEELELAKGRVESLERDVKESLGKLESSVDKGEVDSLKQMLAEKEAESIQLETLKSELVVAKEACASLEAKLGEGEASLAREVESLKVALAAAEEEAGRLKGLEAKMREGEASLVSEMESLKVELAAAEKEASRLKEALAEAQATAVGDADTEAPFVDAPETPSDSEQLAVELTAAKAEVSRLTQLLSESEKQVEESIKLKSDLASALSDVSRLQESIESVKTTLSNDFQKEHEGTQQALHQAINERDGLKAELSLIQAQLCSAAEDAEIAAGGVPKDVVTSADVQRISIQSLPPSKGSPSASIAEVTSPTSPVSPRKSLTGKLYGMVMGSK